MKRSSASALVGALTVVVALAPGVGTAGASPGPRATAAQVSVNRVTDVVLPHGRYDYRRESWRINETSDLPRWLTLRHGRLAGTVPRLGRWKVRLDERGTGRNSGESRSTVLVVEAVRPRAVPGTLLISRGFDGRPANAGSSSASVSGDGRTVVFSSDASNLVPGTDTIAGRLYVWDVAMRRVSLLHPELWATAIGISRDGQRVLVRLSAGLFLIDRAAGTTTQVVARAAEAALTDDGERVVYQDAPGTGADRLLEWTRATGATRTLVPDLAVRTFLGLSPDGRYAAFTAGSSSELWDSATATFRDIGRTGLESGNAQRVEVSDDGAVLSVRGSGIPAGHGTGGDPVAQVHYAVTGGSLGPASHNFGAAITADGSHYAVATPQQHLRVVDLASGDRTSPFLARPSGQETWVSLSDDAAMMAYVSDGHDVLPGTRRGVANIFLWVRPR